MGSMALQAPPPLPKTLIPTQPRLCSAIRLQLREKKVTQSVQKRQHDKAPMKKQTVTPVPLSKQCPESAATTEEQQNN